LKAFSGWHDDYNELGIIIKKVLVCKTKSFTTLCFQQALPQFLGSSACIKTVSPGRVKRRPAVAVLPSITLLSCVARVRLDLISCSNLKAFMGSWVEYDPSMPMRRNGPEELLYNSMPLLLMLVSYLQIQYMGINDNQSTFEAFLASPSALD